MNQATKLRAQLQSEREAAGSDVFFKSPPKSLQLNGMSGPLPTPFLQFTANFSVKYTQENST